MKPTKRSKQMKARRSHGLIAAAILSAALAGASGCSRRAQSPTGDPAPAKAAQRPVAVIDAAKAEQERVQKLPHADPAVPDEQYVQLNSGYQLATLFYALSGMPPDYEALASAASEEYRTTSDEFRKRDLIQALRPKIDEALARFKDPRSRYFTMEQSNLPIQHYDFKTTSFPVAFNIGPTAFSYFNDAPRYRLAYNNGNDFLRFPVTDEQRAKNIEAMVSKNELRADRRSFMSLCRKRTPQTIRSKGGSCE